MMRRLRTCLVLTLVLGPMGHAPAFGQAISTVGTRAQGMGAFVGVADDASAVYWNPAGLAKGAYFSLVLDGSASDAIPDDGTSGGTRANWLLALSMPALGLSYYRLQTASAQPQAAGGFRLNALVTHHAGATLVQSLTQSIAVGATLKVVRGVAGSGIVAASDAENALDDWDVVGRTGNRFDADLGVMMSGEWGRVGLVARNLTEPGFRTGSDLELKLERQVRAGASVILLPGWIMAADADLMRQRLLTGDVREVAIGTEGRITRRLVARGGLRFNTADGADRAPAYSFGASFAAFGSILVDAHVTRGDERAFRGWGVAARFVY